MNKHLPHPAAIAALALVGFLASFSLVTGCKAVGAPDPEVTAKTASAVQALSVVYEVVEADPDTAGAWLDMVDAEMVAILEREGDGALSNLDRQKARRVLVGTRDMRENLETDPAYVRQRAKSLAVLIATIGLYKQDPKLQERVNNIIGGFADEGEDTEAGAAGADSGVGSGSEGEGHEGSGPDSGGD